MEDQYQSKAKQTLTVQSSSFDQPLIDAPLSVDRKLINNKVKDSYQPTQDKFLPFQGVILNKSDCESPSEKKFQVDSKKQCSFNQLYSKSTSYHQQQMSYSTYYAHPHVGRISNSGTVFTQSPTRRVPSVVPHAVKLPKVYPHLVKSKRLETEYEKVFMEQDKKVCSSSRDPWIEDLHLNLDRIFFPSGCKFKKTIK